MGYEEQLAALQQIRSLKDLGFRGLCDCDLTSLGLGFCYAIGSFKNI